jgi:hypothetical protein
MAEAIIREGRSSAQTVLTDIGYYDIVINDIGEPMTHPDPLALADREFKLAFENGSLPREEFRHRNHLRLAWLYLGEGDGLATAERLMETSIRRYATHHGAAHKYHHTITLFWMRAVAAAAARPPRIPTFDAFIEAHSELLDKNLVQRSYSAARLESPAARSGWVEADLHGDNVAQSGP